MLLKLIIIQSLFHLIISKTISKEVSQVVSTTHESFNFCDDLEESIKSFSSLNNTQNLINSLLKRVKERAESAKDYAIIVKNKLISHLNDSDFENGIKHVNNQWEPKIDQKLNDFIKSNKSEDIIGKIFRYMHLYMLGWEKIILDRSVEDIFIEDFKEIQVYTKLLFCEISLALKIVNHDLWKSNWNLKHPNKWEANLSDSRKLIRDYVELKDYLRVLEIIIMLNLDMNQNSH